MKRGGPLKRTTPMPRQSKPLPARSKKTEREYVARRSLVRELLAANPWCQIKWNDDCTGLAVDVDERMGRGVGGDFLDPGNCQTTCRSCHDTKHRNPAEAVRRGVTIQRKAAS